MKIYFIFAWLFFFLCNPQNPKKIIIINKSLSKIDSIKISTQKVELIASLNPEDTIVITPNLSQVNMNIETSETINIFYDSREIEGFWGVRAIGRFENDGDEIFYVFDNGISENPFPPKEPKNYTLFISNFSHQKIDTITGDGILHLNKADNYAEIIFDYKKIKKNPFLNLVQGGKKYSLKIANDWKNWNKKRATIFLSDNGIILPLEQVKKENISKLSQKK